MPKAKKIRRPGLWLFLFLINLIILAMPLSGIYLFRVYENELVRQTEGELIAQAAVLGALFKERALAVAGPDYGLKLGRRLQASGDSLNLIFPTINLAEEPIRPRGFHFSPSPYEMEPTALLAAETLTPVIREASRTTLSKTYILDYHGLVVAGSEGIGLSLAENIEVAEALRGQYKSVMRKKPDHKRVYDISSPSRDVDFWVFAAAPIVNGDRLIGVVALSRTPRSILKALYEERRNLALAAAAVLSLMGLLSVASAILIVGPIKRLSKEALLVADGSQGGLSPEASLKDSALVVREVADLGEAVFTMAERLRYRSDYLKAFASGVSHEFKTPLTSLKGALELLGEHGEAMDSETKKRFEGNVRKDLDRLEKLMDRLLGLARAEAQEPKVSDKTEIMELLQTLPAKFAQDGFCLELEGPGQCLWSGPPEVVDTVLVNLVENARQAGAAMVRIKVDCLENFPLTITISDNGPGLTPEAAANLFTPFFTTRKNKGGTGLGLALCLALLAPYRGRLDYLAPQHGAAFKVTLP